MEKKIIIKLRVKDNYEPLQILIKAIDSTIELYNNIKIKVDKLEKGKK
jgi:DNA-directed RNA polymerase subunit L